MLFSERSMGPLRPAAAPYVMREMNQRLLLDRLFTGGPATRPRLAQDVGLSLPTVSAALLGLKEAGLTREGGRPESASGRPAVLYEADPTAGSVVGVDVGLEWLHVLVTDLVGEQLCALDARNTADSAMALVDLISRTVAEATAKAGISGVTHTVVGTPGVFHPHAGRVTHAANLPGWQELDLSQALSERLGESLTIDNDANLAALGEHAYGVARGVDQFAYLTIGTGVGLGLILNGRLYRGFTGSAGEVGYLPIGKDPSVRRPHNQWRGMLEEAVSASAVVNTAKELGMTEARNAADVFTAARTGHPAARTAVQAEAKRLAMLVASIYAFLDPELIVFGGGIGQNLDLLEPQLRESMAEVIPSQPNLAVGSLQRRAVVRGAVAIGIEHAREIAFRKALAAVAARRQQAADRTGAGRGEGGRSAAATPR